MSISNGPNLGLMVNGAAGDAHYSQFMAFLRGVDGLVMPNVKGYLTNTPPGSPSDGDSYIIGAAPTGAWAGQGGKVTRYSTVAVAWEFYTPKNGWMLQANSARETYLYTASAWEIYYQEGTWTPTATNLTGTSVSYSTKYIKVGLRTDFSIQVNGTGLGATAGSTGLSLPFTPSRSGTCVMNDQSWGGVGNCFILTDGNVYLPTCSGKTQFFISGVLLN